MHLAEQRYAKESVLHMKKRDTTLSSLPPYKTPPVQAPEVSPERPQQEAEGSRKWLQRGAEFRARGPQSPAQRSDGRRGEGVRSAPYTDERNRGGGGTKHGGDRWGKRADGDAEGPRGLRPSSDSGAWG